MDFQPGQSVIWLHEVEGGVERVPATVMSAKRTYVRIRVATAGGRYRTLEVWPGRLELPRGDPNSRIEGT